MADVEEPQYSTLAERIAALNQQKNFKSPPPNVKAKRAPPPPPPSGGRPVAQLRSQSSPVPAPNGNNGAMQRSPTIPAPPPSSQAAPPPLPRRTTVAVDRNEASPPLPGRTLAPPPLPSRGSSQQASPTLPGLPPRRPSTQMSAHNRRNSNDSEKSYVSTISALSLNHTTSATSVGSGESQSLRKLPPTLDQAKLPPLPPTRRELEARAKETAAREAANIVKAPAVGVGARAIEAAPPRPSLPPRLPSRPLSGRVTEAEPTPALPARRLPPPPSSYVRPTTTNGFGSQTQPHQSAAEPPPVPLASRPSFAQIDAAQRAPPPVPTAADCCLTCRDFSGPDTVAAQYPIAGLPRRDAAAYLAQHLCGPFSSPTDKARAIFTWCHHNIAYDVDGFFGGCIPRGQTPDESIYSGKAVCEGYARIYEAIAVAAGLECYLVGGHGKGFGFAPVFPGDPVPALNATGHAWNAVRIDGGEWKLLDACWGAGNVCDKRAQRYEKKFDPVMFTMSNEKFGERHFPEDARRFYRADGRPLPWAQYIVEKTRDPPAQVYLKAKEEGVDEETMSPRARDIAVSRLSSTNEVVRFQFGKSCEHWTYEKHGGGRKPYLMMIKIGGVDGRKEDFVPMDEDGFWWYCDIPARDLGAPGQKVWCYTLETLNNANARGVTKHEFLSKKGRCAMSWSAVACWELV